MKYLQNIYRSIAESNAKAAVLISVVCLITFGNTILNDYNLDDNLVTQNHRLTSKGIKAIPEIYSSPYYQDDMGYSYGYRPTTLASFAIEHEIFGESATVSHTINLILYLITCFLVYFLIKRLFPEKAGIALGAALLFTVHPIHTEVVASIKNRDEILALLFAMLGCFVLIKPKRFIPSLITASVFFFLSLSSKMSGVNFILLLALVPAYPKPFLKDIALLSLYVLSLYFVFEGRDVLFDNRYRNIATVLLGFMLLRIVSSNYYRLILKSSIKSVIIRSRLSIKAILDNAIDFSSYMHSVFRTMHKKYSFSRIRAVEITISSLTTLFLIQPYEDFNLRSLTFSVILLSFLFFRTNQPDAFFRYSIALIIAGKADEYIAFVIFNNILLLLSSQSNLKTTVIHQIFGVSLTITLVLLDTIGAGNLPVTNVHLAILFSLIVGRSNSKLLAVLMIPILAVLIWLSSQFFNLVFWIPLLYGVAIFLPVYISKDSWISEKLSLCSKPVSDLDKKSSLSLGSIPFIFSLISIVWFHSNDILWMSETVLHNLNQLVGAAEYFLEQTITNINSVNKIFDPDAIWSAEYLGSWKRPFDYIEHPLSPFAPLSWKLGTGVVTLAEYLKKLFVPYPLAFYYGFDEVKIYNLISVWSLISITIHSALMILAAFLWDRAKYFGIGVLLYLSSIALFSGLAEMVAGMFSDRFSYVASVGFCLAIVAGTYILLTSTTNKGTHTILVSAALAVLISFSSYSISRNALWKNKLTLMSHDIRNVPNSAQAHNLLAHAIMEDVFKDNSVSDSEVKNIQLAETHFARATEIYPLFFNAWVDLGRVYDVLGNTPKSINARERAFAIDSTYPPIALQIAQGHETLGNYEQAITYYRNYLQLVPNSFEAHDNLARILFQRERYQESLEVCEAYLIIDTANESFRNNLMVIQNLLNQKEPAEN